MGIYHNSIVVEPYIICNKVLQPFSSYHLLLLREANSPFLSEVVVEADIKDLAKAILICSTSFKQHQYDKQQPLKALKKYKRKFKQLIFYIFFNNIKKRICKAGLDAQDYVNEFYDYITAHIGSPTYKPTKDISVSAIEPIFSVVACMIYSMNFSEEDAWDLPLSRANAYRGYVMEINGNKLLPEDKIDKAKEAKNKINENKQWLKLKEEYKAKGIE